ncbi:MAG: molybdenum cofactor guanylyltransferase [Chloroflexi bacterium]|nr:molybdenum cofactor guanylyltransferase [Chloroflexota bacterium]
MAPPPGTGARPGPGPGPGRGPDADRGPAPPPNLTAIVLAGGRSARFGSNKLRAELGGRAILHLAIEAVAEVADSIVVVAPPGATLILPDLPRRRDGRIRVVHDPEPFGGPLVGLEAALAALAATPSGDAIVVGGDMPRLVPAVLRRLVATLRERQAGAAVLEVPDRVQPLPAALAVAPALEAARMLLARDRRSLRDLLGAVETVTVPASEWLVLDPAAASVVDIDRPEDLERMRAAELRRPDGTHEPHPRSPGVA